MPQAQERKATRIFARLLHTILIPVEWLYFIYYSNNKLFVREIGKDKYQYKKVNKQGATVAINHKKGIKKIRFKNVEASILHNPAATFSIILSYVALLLTTYFSFNGRFFDHVFSLRFDLTILGVGLLLLLPIPAYLNLYVTKLPLEEYAIIYRNQLTESQMLCLNCYKIFEICSKFDQEIKWLTDDMLVNQRESDAFFETGKWENNTTLNLRLTEKVNRLANHGPEFHQLQFKIQFLERELERIFLLISNLADRLNVSDVQLCDHIFQFSPNLYKIRMKKFLSNLYEVISFQESHDVQKNVMHPPADLAGPKFNRIRSALFECYRFRNRNRRICLYQCQNIVFTGIHPSILAFATQKSSCESTRTYIKALMEIIKSEDNDDCYLEKIKYVFYKRKAHIGVDLHHSSATLLKDMLPVLKTTGDKYDKLVDFFRLDFFSGSFKSAASSIQQHFISEGKQVANEFIQFQLFTLPYIEQCRQKISECFKLGYNDFFRQLKQGMQFYIVTFGYSKIIRDLIKYTIPRMIRLQEGPMDNFRGQVNAIVFSPEKETKVDSRYIKHELTEGKLEGAL